jgi:hypothetical protein
MHVRSTTSSFAFIQIFAFAAAEINTCGAGKIRLVSSETTCKQRSEHAPLISGKSLSVVSLLFDGNF